MTYLITIAASYEPGLNLHATMQSLVPTGRMQLRTLKGCNNSSPSESVGGTVVQHIERHQQSFSTMHHDINNVAVSLWTTT